MKRFAKIISLTAAFALLCGCTRLPNRVDPDTSNSTDDQSNISRPNVDYHETGLKEFSIRQQDFISRLNAESGVHNGALSNEGEFNGSGYVKLHEGNTLEHIVRANTTQFYRIVLAARSDTGASVSLAVEGSTVGAYYIPKREPESDGSFPFEYYEIDCLFLSSGNNNIKLTVGSGDVDVDYILVENSDHVDDNWYTVGSACANPYSSLKAMDVMTYFSEVYGQSVLTAQNVSPASNAEIEAVYRATGRYPAIRSSEIAYLTLDSDEDKERVKSETELAVRWSKDGGLQSYIWHWYSPNIRKSVNAGDFNIEAALEYQVVEETAMFTDEDIEALRAGGNIPSELVSLLKDIDKMAEFLKRFDEADAVVLFQPLPDGDSGLYWWGRDARNYQKLWRLMFERLCRYHKIHCLIWVWNGSDMDYYPGSNYVDIIGQSFFENSNSSFASRFQSLGSIVPSQKMMAAVNCDILPNIDYMFRDHATWLWTAPAAGDYTLDMNGALSESYNSVTYMKTLYNHEFTVARDELPDFD